MLHFKILPRKIEVDIERHISSWNDSGTCSPLTHVKYEEAERANSNWSNLLPVPCNVIPLMLIHHVLATEDDPEGKKHCIEDALSYVTK